jgi:ABC-2 type transport system permease protein
MKAMDARLTAPRLRASNTYYARPSMRELMALYWRLVGARTRGLMQYKFSFVVMTAASLAATGTDYVGVHVLFGRIPQLANFTFPEVAFMFGLTLVCYSLAEVPTPGFELLPRLIIQGGFDRVLTRPLGAFYQTLASDVSPRKLIRGLLGLAILLGAQQAIPVEWTFDRLLVVALAIPSGAAIFFCIFVCGAASTFWTVQANEIVNVFTNGGVTMLTYPLDVYHDWLKRFVTFVVPLGFVSYYPTLYLLGRADALGLPTWIGFLSPIAAALFSVLAWITWSLGVRHYASVGN